MKPVEDHVSGVARIARERMRQKSKWTDAHDDGHVERELVMAAATLILGEHMDPARAPAWAIELFGKHAGPNGYLRRLEIAGALLAAEIDRELRTNVDQLDEDRKLVARLCAIDEGLTEWEVGFAVRCPCLGDICDRAGVLRGYGFFPGGDPRLFDPDSENRPEELSAWKAACTEADSRDVTVLEGSCSHHHDAEGNVLIVTRSGFGLGGYELPCPELPADLRAKVLAQLITRAKARREFFAQLEAEERAQDAAGEVSP